MQRGYHDVQGVGGQMHKLGHMESWRGPGGWRGATVWSHGVMEGARRMERCNSGGPW